ncbi:MAG: POTRA domain-containing protein [Terriglobia bacterium]
MRGRVTRKFAFLFLLFSPALWAAEAPFIQSLQIRGTRRPLEHETHAGQALDPARVERDLRRWWATGWFDDIRVEREETSEGVHLVFTLVERPRLYLREVKFEPEREQRPLGLAKDQPIDAVLAKKVAAALRARLVEEGFADAVVEAELVPAGFQLVDLRLRAEPGRPYRIEQVRFRGSLGLQVKELKGALRSTRPRRLLPGFGLWKGWRLLAPLSEQRLADDVDRLRSLYLARGYFDARVGVAAVDIHEGKAQVTVEAEAGPRYRVRELRVAGAERAEEISPQLDGSFAARELCRCLLRARREAEKQGRPGFAARLELRPAPPPRWAFLTSSRERPERGEKPATEDDWVELTARVESGPVYHVGRIEFRGHHAVGDATLRRALTLEEGERFDEGCLRTSLARLSELALLEPVSLADVRAGLDTKRGEVNLTIPVAEAKRGRWALSGPLGALSAFGPLQFSLGSRLPALGPSAFELSTYAATLSLVALPARLTDPFLLASGTRLRPLLALERPLLPGRRWQSGFRVSPQLGWRTMASHYAVTQARAAAGSALSADAGPSTALAVPSRWRTEESEDASQRVAAAGVLRCQPRKSRWRWVPAAAGMAADWLLLASLL